MRGWCPRCLESRPATDHGPSRGACTYSTPGTLHTRPLPAAECAVRVPLARAATSLPPQEWAARAAAHALQYICMDGHVFVSPGPLSECTACELSLSLSLSGPGIGQQRCESNELVWHMQQPGKKSVITDHGFQPQPAPGTARPSTPAPPAAGASSCKRTHGPRGTPSPYGKDPRTGSSPAAAAPTAPVRATYAGAHRGLVVSFGSTCGDAVLGARAYVRSSTGFRNWCACTTAHSLSVSSPVISPSFALSLLPWLRRICPCASLQSH